MNVEFYSSHVETLVDLIKIAQKHDSVITFGSSSTHDREIDEDILLKAGFSKENLDELKEKMTIKESASLFDRCWFQLYEKKKKQYHTMVYIESETYLLVEKAGTAFYCDVELEASEELLAKLEEHDELLDLSFYTIIERYNPTIITGFDNEKRVEDFRVYRSGMALKFFGDLVCDYFGEERIQRVY